QMARGFLLTTGNIQAWTAIQTLTQRICNKGVEIIQTLNQVQGGGISSGGRGIVCFYNAK
ncbi:MAG: hypothetical protein IKQ23_09355, partial [Treponema sp.]|nr:hypothetical protein [Treponema sp.]